MKWRTLRTVMATVAGVTAVALALYYVSMLVRYMIGYGFMLGRADLTVMLIATILFFAKVAAGAFMDARRQG